MSESFALWLSGFLAGIAISGVFPSRPRRVSAATLVDGKFIEALTALAKRVGKTKEDVIRDALNYYEYALNEWEDRRTKARCHE